jgi:hypothetical protein
MFSPFVAIARSAPVWTVAMVIVILIIDHLSFLQTYYFIKYASRAGGILEMLFIAYADVVLSVNIFLFIFPLFVVAFACGAMSIPYHGRMDISFSGEPTLIIEPGGKGSDAISKYASALKQMSDSVRSMRSVSGSHDLMARSLMNWG